MATSKESYHGDDPGQSASQGPAAPDPAAAGTHCKSVVLGSQVEAQQRRCLTRFYVSSRGRGRNQATRILDRPFAFPTESLLSCRQRLPMLWNVGLNLPRNTHSAPMNPGCLKRAERRLHIHISSSDSACARYAERELLREPLQSAVRLFPVQGQEQPAIA